MLLIHQNQRTRSHLCVRLADSGKPLGIIACCRGGILRTRRGGGSPCSHRLMYRIHRIRNRAAALQLDLRLLVKQLDQGAADKINAENQ